MYLDLGQFGKYEVPFKIMSKNGTFLVAGADQTKVDKPAKGAVLILDRSTGSRKTSSSAA